MIRLTARQFTGRHMLTIMLAFFATVLAANMSMLYFATRSWTGLVVKNSYVASQQFNEATAKLERAAAGIRSKFSYSNGMLAIVLTDSTGKAVEATNVTVNLGRPSHEGEDRSIVLIAQGNGNYSIKHDLAKGQWSGEVTANMVGHPQWLRPVRLRVGN
jgi:nitrogen fixation protein FixH